MAVTGEVSSLVQRKDHDFNDIHAYLTVQYPNILVPSLPAAEQMKKFSDSYMNKRAAYLSRFVSYCLASETIKQDFLF